MQTQDRYRRKTRSQLVDQEKSASRVQIPSLSNMEGVQLNSEIQSNKINEPKKQPARKSNWNKKEKVKYLVFLNYYSELPHWSSDLKSIPTYKALSLFVKSRSPEQCKSFHLSTRRNYKSIEQEIKAIQEQLQIEQGYHKMMDKYELEIIGFQEEQKLLELFQLEEKKYFRDKLIQKCKQNGFNKEINRNGQSPVQVDYNPKINIKELINKKEFQEMNKDPASPAQDSIQPLVNIQNHLQRGQNLMQPISPSNYNQPNFPVPNVTPPNIQQSNMGFYAQKNSFNSKQKSMHIEKSQMESMRQQNTSNQNANSDNRTIPICNQRAIQQQNFNRMMEANKNMFGQFGNYATFAPSAFGSMSQMHLAQFRNQLPYSIPPPGGIPYMIQGYQEPYRMSGIQHRYVAVGEGQNEKNKSNQAEIKNQQQSGETNRPRANEGKESKVYSQKKKQLLLSCHQHWVNWLRAATQLNRRKQIGRDIPVNNTL